MKIGVIGGGQLGRMLALAGTPLGMSFAFLDPAPDACSQALGEHGYRTNKAPFRRNPII